MKHAALIASALMLVAPAASATTLTLFASGEDLATEGFTEPRLTKDGWALEFSRIIAHVDQVTAWQSEPPFMGDGPDIEGTALEFGGPFTVDLVDADDADLVELARIDADPGFYNALSWALSPAPQGEFEGFSLVFEGIARRDGDEVTFTLATRDAILHACGEYVGDTRKGFVTEDAGSELEITLHLDHLFGRADRPADSATNLEALGFDAFADGGMHEFTLGDLHVGHVGEGHCHDQTM
ncbi:MAG: hypothetical protein EA386_06940 [Rhodobacteraceae bacterium]|nr:MAG: hypothetical protein EA386_06940 [Paracoccaceae bacterium]